MTRRRRARHLRRRRGPLVILVLATVLAVAGGVAGVRFLEVRRQRIDVKILVGGVVRPVRVVKPATVAAALEAAKVVPRPGRLLSVVTKAVLNPALTPPQLLVDGLPATPESPLIAGVTIGVVEPPDVTEAAVDGVEAIPAPEIPRVVRSLWHPGQPGKAVNRKGAVSGELVAQMQVQPPVPPVPVGAKLVALTFDDGPWPTTPEVLRILREKNVKATFCVTTRQLKKEGLATIKGAIGEGHQLCNHTVNHDGGLPGKSQKVIDQEIKGANQQLVERTGIKPTYYRPPGGKLGPNIEATVKAEGQHILMWSVDTKDYTKPPPEAIVGAVMGNIQPGGIVLMHDGGGDRGPTLAALPVLIDQLRAAGYEMVLPDAVGPVAPAPEIAATLPA